MKFRDIPGHEDVKTRIRDLVDTDRIPHALLLEGPEGAGKFALARAMAQYIHCTDRKDGDSCGKCPSCIQHQTYNHIDTIHTFPVVKKSGTGLSDDYIGEFRELMDENMFMDFESWLLKLDNINAQPMIYVEEANEMIRKLSYTTHASKYKIVLMWLPERMREDAANKLLKLIEEPHEDTLFIMSSDNSRGILPTIYSRTQRISVKRYADAEIREYLERHAGVGDASETARLASGSMTQALKSLTVSKDGDLFLQLFMELMRKAYVRKVGDLKKWATDVAALGREREMEFLDYCSRMLRENFINNLHTRELNFMNAAESAFSIRFSPFINERNVLKLFDLINEARADIAMNANAKLVNFDVAVKVILLLK